MPSLTNPSFQDIVRGFCQMINIVKSLYQTDYHQWIEETVKQLEKGQYEAVDWINLIEEVKDLGKSEKMPLKTF